jgi:hypothetical protein
MTNSIIQQGSPNAKASTVVQEKAKLEELNVILQDLKNKIDILDLKTEVIGELLSEVNTVEVQCSSPKPKYSIINESIKTITSILQGVSANALTPIILERLQNLVS